MNRRLDRIEPAATAPSTARKIAGLFTAVGVVGAVPALFLILTGSIVLLGGAATSFGDGNWFVALGIVLWLALGLAQFRFHVARALVQTSSLRNARFWWLLTFVYNALYAIGCAVLSYLDLHPGPVVATAWFSLLAVLAVVAFQDDGARRLRHRR